MEDIKQALIETTRAAHLPMPQFHGKKGEKPEDHVMKVDDYFTNYNVKKEHMTLRFKDTCFGKARMWLSTLDPYPDIYAPDDTMTQAQKDATLKSKFLQRWQLMGRTHDSIFAHFERFKFDQSKDDIEDFCNDMK